MRHERPGPERRSSPRRSRGRPASLRHAVAVLALPAAALLPGGDAARAADHRDAPIFSALGFEAQVDINDIYVFASPERPASTAMILTVSPLAGLFGPKTFAAGANHDFNLDYDGDAREDAVYRVTFARPDRTGAQRMKLRFRGPGERYGAEGAVGAEIALPGGGRLVAGIFDDPFFFDLLAFRLNLQFSQQSPSNFFRGLNTLAIVLEVPNSSFHGPDNGSGTYGLWCATSRGRRQIDRMGRPAINTVLVPSASKEAFNRAHPSGDLAAFGPGAGAIITSLSNATNAATLVPILFPDVLTFQPGNTSGFLNGRRLEDDVIDAELDLLSGGAVKSDFVGNDSAFRTTFPYLALPNP
jgi:hypothetical protein